MPSTVDLTSDSDESMAEDTVDPSLTLHNSSTDPSTGIVSAGPSASLKPTILKNSVSSTQSASSQSSNVNTVEVASIMGSNLLDSKPSAQTLPSEGPSTGQPSQNPAKQPTIGHAQSSQHSSQQNFASDSQSFASMPAVLHGNSTPSVHTMSSVSSGSRVQFATDQASDPQLDVLGVPPGGSVGNKKQPILNPYKRPGRGFRNSKNTTGSSPSGSHSSGTASSQRNYNRFAALQEPEQQSNSGTESAAAATTKTGSTAATDQELANQLFGPGWTPVSHSKDSPATLAASRARLLGVKIVKKGRRGGSRIHLKDIVNFFDVVASVDPTALILNHTCDLDSAIPVPRLWPWARA